MHYLNTNRENIRTVISENNIKKEIPMRASIKEFMHEIKICAKNQ